VTDSPNVELVRSILASWGRGDFGEASQWAHPEIELVLADGPDPGSYKGLAEMTRGWRARMSAWEKGSLTAEEFRELDGGRVLVLGRFSGQGKRSGLDLNSKAANIFDVRDGRVTRIARYWDRDRALADLGLPPEVGAA
jgi:ketosteroid isomerase-like protein